MNYTQIHFGLSTSEYINIGIGYMPSEIYDSTLLGSDQRSNCNL